MKKVRPLIGIILSCLLIAFCFIPQVQTFLSMPDSQKMVVGEANLIKINLPQKVLEKLDIEVLGSSQSVFAAQADPPVVVTRNNSGYQIMALKPGKAHVRLNLLGYIPIKSMQIETLLPRRVVVGGQSIGVLLQSRGIMVVGYASVIDAAGNKQYPGRDQGVEIGDLILKVDDQPVYTEVDLAQIIDSKKGQEIRLSIKRRDKTIIVPVTGAFCAETNRYRVGLFVRDGVVGVGTLTFWDPDSHQYAALGHLIVDADTKQGIDVLKGRVVSASIQTIKPGKPGRPGEKIGIFNEQGQLKGTISKNSRYGIFGQTETEVKNPLSKYTMEVAYSHQVKIGPAQILTVVNGEDIEKFDISIEKIFPRRQNGKNMVIRVTDPRLLSVAGGIVQGMSGSPIIQDGKLVGAVTHVFLNDPGAGYGVFMDNVLSEMPAPKQNGKKIPTNF